MWKPEVSYEPFAAPRQEGIVALTTVMDLKLTYLEDRWAEDYGIL